MSTSFKEDMGLFVAQFDPFLFTYLHTAINKAALINDEAHFCLEEVLRLAKSGGKRLRPSLVWAGFMIATEGSNPTQAEQEAIFTLGASLELFHTFALIHDDIIDQALTRRSEPTIEAEYKRVFKIKGFSPDQISHFSLSAAILAGDYAHMLAYELVSSLPYPTLQALYSQMAFELVAGQIDDCFGVGIDSFDNVSKERIVNMLINKSGNYSIQKPVLLGITLAQNMRNLPANTTNISAVGENIGLLFQYTDDLLGIFGNELKLGKSTKSDILEGKRTLLMAQTYHDSSDEEKTQLRRILGNTQASEADIAWVKNNIIQTGNKEKYENMCKDLSKSVETELKSDFKSNPGINFLLGLTEYLLVREK